jgi:hypothetical protein
MNEQAVEALSRRAAASMSRRGSLLSLGGALAAAVAAPSLAQAKSSKNAKKAKKRKARQRAAERAENQANQACQSQVAGCKTHLLSVCRLSGGRCIAAAECCSSLGACNTAEFFACLVAVSNSETG